MPDNCTTLQMYYDHYKDTFEQIKRYLAKRDRITIYLIILIATILFFAIDADKSAVVVGTVLQNKAGISDVSFSVINTVSLFVLLYFIFSYYQVCLLIERSYIYLHNVENTLSQMAEVNIDRESQNYLNNYPVVSSIAHLFYTYGLPSGLIAVSILKACIEWPPHFLSINTLDVIILFASVLVSIIYIIDRIMIAKSISWKEIFNKCNKGKKNKSTN